MGKTTKQKETKDARLNELTIRLEKAQADVTKLSEEMQVRVRRDPFGFRAAKMVAYFKTADTRFFSRAWYVIVGNHEIH